MKEDKFINITHLSKVCETKESAYSMLRNLIKFSSVKRFAIIKRHKESYCSCNIDHVALDKSIELAHSIIGSANARYQLHKWVGIRDILEKIKLLDVEHSGLIPETSDVFVEHRVGKKRACRKAKSKKLKSRNNFVKKFNEIYGEKK